MDSPSPGEPPHMPGLGTSSCIAGSPQHPQVQQRDGEKTKVCVAISPRKGLLEEPALRWPGPRTPPGNASGEGKAAQSPFGSGRGMGEGSGKQHGAARELVMAQPHGELGMSSPSGGKPVPKCLCPHPRLLETPVLPAMEARRGKGCPSRAQRGGGKAPDEPGGPAWAQPLPARTRQLSLPPREADFHPRTKLKTSTASCPRSVSGGSLLENVTR